MVEMLVVGYGTFITNGIWKQHENCKICRVLEYRRVYNPEMARFPFAIKDETSSFLALSFEVPEDEINHLDHIEGVKQGLYSRIITRILILVDNILANAWMYVPTEQTRNHPYFPWDDYNDLWMVQNILSDNELLEMFRPFL